MTTAYPNSDFAPLPLLAYWIIEREAIRLRKESGDKPPWTADPILRAYRFCNVHREDDRVTQWIKTNWREPHWEDPNLWHAMLIARYINWPDTLLAMGYPEPWPQMRKQATRAIQLRQQRGQKVFTGAYIVSTNGAPMNKITYVLSLFESSWDKGWFHSELGSPATLKDAYTWLTSIKGVGSFMAAQIIADLKYTPMLNHARDWGEWCAPGPGSQRGLNRVLSMPLPQQWRPDKFILALRAVRVDLKPLLPNRIDLKDLQDLQNCLCEYDKYVRVLKGMGRPRSRYHPTLESAA